MIPVKREPKDLQLERWGLEQCVFCQQRTPYWHVKTNNPVCQSCAKVHRVLDLKTK